jgi:hypothetical protein
MAKLVIQPTSTAQWHALVSEAECAASCVLTEDLESYLVFLLMRFASNPHMLARVIALDYLNNTSTERRTRHEKLRDVGDQCLLFSGLFPKQAERRMVKVSYFVDLGRSAYQQLSDTISNKHADIYANLSRDFVSLMDILQTMRELQGSRSALTPLHAYELWNDTGSRHAFKIIRTLTDACPVRSDVSTPGLPFADYKMH